MNMRGLVKNLIPGKFYGFILEPITKNEYFFHREDFNGFWDDLMLDVGKDRLPKIEVTFDIVDSPKGPRANNVKRLDYPNQVD